MRAKLDIKKVESRRLLCLQAKSFPEDIKSCWEDLTQRIPKEHLTPCYGLSKCEGDTMKYLAGVHHYVSQDSALGELNLEGGAYAIREIMDWKNHVDEIGQLFGEMEEEVDVDPERWFVECYTSEERMELWVPVHI